MRHACAFVPAARLLHDSTAGFQELDLTRDLRFDCKPHRLERVHVLDLGLRSERRAAGGANRDVGIATQRAFFHLDVGDAELHEGTLERIEIGDRFFSRCANPVPKRTPSTGRPRD